MSAESGTRPYDVACWFVPEDVNVTDIGRIVTPAHYTAQVEPEGATASGSDMPTLHRRCEALLDHTVLLELELDDGTVRVWPEDQRDPGCWSSGRGAAEAGA